MRLWPLLALLLAACRVEPDPPSLRSSKVQPTEGSSSPLLEFLPGPSHGKTTAVLHLHITLPENTLVAPSSVALVKGELSDTALRGLKEGNFPSSARGRAVPIAIRSEPGNIWVFHTKQLELGTIYTLAIGQLNLRSLFIVDEEGPPILERIWPPPGEVSEDALAIYCGKETLLEAMEPVSFGAPIDLQYGIPEHRETRSCVSLSIPSVESAGAIPAALQAHGEVIALLDPAPLQRGTRGASTQLLCTKEEQAFGPGCLAVQDDRALWRLPPEPLLLLSREGPPQVLRSGMIFRGLIPSSSSSVDATVLDLHGEIHHLSTVIETSEARPHPILTEVLADALGPEPASEWIELYNDGSLPIQATGWVLEDGQGPTLLPDFEVAPGAFMLFANEDLNTSSDAPIPPGCQVLHVPKLGKNGLSNQGESLSLKDAAGNLLAYFPASPRPKPGLSVQQRSLDFLDTDSGGYIVSQPTPCTPYF